MPSRRLTSRASEPAAEPPRAATPASPAPVAASPTGERTARRAGARPCASRAPVVRQQRAEPRSPPPAPPPVELPQPVVTSSRGRRRRPNQPRRSGWWAQALARQLAGRRSGAAGACMKSGWVDRDAQATVERYAARRRRAPTWRCASTRRGCSAAIRALVLHGGGNTSVKTAHARPARRGDRRALRQGLGLRHGRRSSRPACRRCGSTACASCARATTLTDEDMVRVQRANLLDPTAPNPSVETLLHAFLPHKFVDHTHATAVLSLVDQPDGEAICARGLWRPRRHRALRHAGLRARQGGRRRVRRAIPTVEGLILHKHGIFTFGDERARSL